MRLRYNCVSKVFLVLAFTCAISVAVQAGQGSASDSQSNWSANTYAPPPLVVHRDYHRSGLLVVNRSPDFGTYLVLNLRMDGRPIGNLTWGYRFEAAVPPGHHVLTVVSLPKPGVRLPISIPFNVEPGRTYVFSAVWESDRVVLREWENWRLAERLASNW